MGRRFPWGWRSVVYFLGVAIYPAVLQKFMVAPNELLLEAPYIENNIRLTRLGYDLDRIQEIPFDVAYNLTAGTSIGTMQPSGTSASGIMPRCSAPTASCSRSGRITGSWTSTTTAITVDGKYLQVMLSPRELFLQRCRARRINERLIFTHGNGLTLGP